jgi:hypothetical protein
MRTASLAVAALSLLAVPARPAAAAVLRIVTVKTADVASYLKGVERGNALLKKGGSPALMRVWRGQFAGADAGKLRREDAQGALGQRLPGATLGRTNARRAEG